MTDIMKRIIATSIVTAITAATLAFASLASATEGEDIKEPPTTTTTAYIYPDFSAGITTGDEFGGWATVYWNVNYDSPDAKDAQGIVKVDGQEVFRGDILAHGGAFPLPINDTGYVEVYVDWREVTQPLYSGQVTVCAEDEPCWDCRTMGNLLCGVDIDVPKVEVAPSADPVTNANPAFTG